jgi:DEAD/DEAH box helicase domain-containing protein
VLQGHAKKNRLPWVVRSYRVGYKPELQREFERELFADRCVSMGRVIDVMPVVVATSALELGVDIGSLDAVVHCGFSYSVASFFQQAGRVE